MYLYVHAYIHTNEHEEALNNTYVCDLYKPQTFLQNKNKNVNENEYEYEY